MSARRHSRKPERGICEPIDIAIADSPTAQRLLEQMAPKHLPIFRLRWKSHRQGEERRWNYSAPSTEEAVIRLWNSRGYMEVEPLTVELLENALTNAYEAGAAYEKFGNPSDRLYARLGYRRCSRRRLDSIANLFLSRGAAARRSK